jgi:hypothetical protein
MLKKYFNSRGLYGEAAQKNETDVVWDLLKNGRYLSIIAIIGIIRFHLTSLSPDDYIA